MTWKKNIIEDASGRHSYLTSCQTRTINKNMVGRNKETMLNPYRPMKVLARNSLRNLISIRKCSLHEQNLVMSQGIYFYISYKHVTRDTSEDHKEQPIPSQPWGQVQEPYLWQGTILSNIKKA